jgi:hypothetical protein
VTPIYVFKVVALSTEGHPGHFYQAQSADTELEAVQKVREAVELMENDWQEVLSVTLIDTR